MFHRQAYASLDALLECADRRYHRLMPLAALLGNGWVEWGSDMVGLYVVGFWRLAIHYISRSVASAGGTKLALSSSV